MAKCRTTIKELLKVTGIPVLVASLCCLSPLLLVVFGLGTVAVAASLADLFYGVYKWYFRGAGLLLLGISLWWYFYKAKGICTLDHARKERTMILNTILLALIIGVVGYIFFLYVVVHYWGVWLQIW